MKIAIVVETFARDMGYISTTLPKYLARNGADVHVLASSLSPYHQAGAASAVFGERFAERNRNVPGARESPDGYTVHTLAHRKSFGYARLSGLFSTLRDIAPDVVCIFQATGWIPLDCARHRKQLGYRLAIGSHTGKTMFNPTAAWSLKRARSFALRAIPGWYIASQSECCVVPTLDCADVVSAYFGVPVRLVKVMNLPVDTDFFYPDSGPLRPVSAKPSNRAELRAQLGIAEADLLCVYSGKFSADKNALVLAQATEILRSRAFPVRALFVGTGEQEQRIKANASALVLPFMPINELGDYYRAADIGVWMNESVSFLDGACCGLPLLLSDVVKDTTHLREFMAGFAVHDAPSLARQIVALLDATERARRGELAARLGEQRFSAQRYALKRLEQFRAMLAGEFA